MTRIFMLILVVAGSLSCRKSPLDEILADAPQSVRQVIDNPEKYEPQIYYVRIDRNENNAPSFTTYTHNADPDRYFYPASTVKFPVAVMALSRLNNLAIPGLDRHTRMQTDSVRPPQSRVLLDSTAEAGVPSVAHYVRKIFIVSDNDAYNRLYEFLGWDHIQATLRSKGFARSRIIHRLSDPRFGPVENRYTNPVQFFDHDTLVYAQDEQVARDTVRYRPNGERRGVAFINGDGERVEQPFDFSMKNFFPLEEQVRLLQSIMFPQATPAEERFNLTQEDYRFLYSVMCMLPRESSYPRYEGEDYYDSYVKFLIYGDQRDPMPGHLRIFNKVGWAYGYLTDCAYIVDFENKIEFILAATVHVNENNTFNDGIYEFDEVGLPFLAELGRQVYAYELQRERAFSPDLSHLTFTRLHD